MTDHTPIRKILYWVSPFVFVIGALIQFLLFDDLCNIERARGLSLIYNAVPAILLAAIAILPRRKSLTILLGSILFLSIDIWLICNVMYFRANNLYITWQVAQLAGQLWGFRSSLSACWSASLLLFPLISLLSVLTYASIQPAQAPWRVVGAFWGLWLGMFLVSGNIRYNTRRHPAERSIAWFSPISIPESETSGVWATDFDKIVYIRMHSIADYLICFFYDACKQPDQIELSDEDIQNIHLLCSEPVEANPPQGHLIYILVESMEGWLLDYTTPNGELVCPRIQHWIEGHPSLVCTEVHSQKMYGESGDGQMICMTGMLPIDDGVACNTYGANIYPNLAHFYPNSIVFNPTPYMWNQDVTSYSYGFKQLIEPVKETGNWSDRIIFEKAKESLAQADEPTCALLLTVDTHMPFTSNHSSIELPDTMDPLQRDYICSFHYTDSVIGDFLSWADANLPMEQTTIVITGDHYAFASGFPGCTAYRCPVVITSPAIQEEIRPVEMYQMDIYTTLLHAIGQESYFWKGFGMNYLDHHATRPVPLETAWQLSNKMIRTNYFKHAY